MARTHIWDVPSLRFVEPARAGSPTGSNAREQAAERYLKESREDGETDCLKLHIYCLQVVSMPLSLRLSIILKSGRWSPTTPQTPYQSEQLIPSSAGASNLLRTAYTLSIL